MYLVRMKTSRFKCLVPGILLVSIIPLWAQGNPSNVQVESGLKIKKTISLTLFDYD